MKKVVLKVEWHDDRIKQKAMRAVSGISGVESVSVDTKDSKMTLTGEIDPVGVVGKLRKVCHTDIVSVGPAKEEKKEEKKESDPKKPEDEKKPNTPVMWPYPFYPQYHYVRSVDEDPNACVIC